MKTTQQKPTVTAPPAAMPDTPPDHTYCLDMYENNDVSIDSYELTRAEFNTLKQHLAGLRGLIPAVAEPAAAPTQPTQPPAPETVPALDPLRGVQNFYDLEKKQPLEAKALRAQLLDQITRALPKMDTAQVQEIAQFLDLCTNNRGCLTPAEGFIVSLVNSHYLFGGLTPEAVMDEFEGPEGCKRNYEECIEMMERFNAVYGQPGGGRE